MHFLFPIATLLAALSLPAFCQTAPTNSANALPDYVVYSSILHRVTWFETQADKLKSQGLNDSFYRTMIQRQAELNDKETATLKSVAADWTQKNTAILGAPQAVRAQGASAANTQQIQNLQAQRIQAVRDHISQIQAAFGAVRFPVFDDYVRQNAAVQAPTGGLPPSWVVLN